jgi:hypothetical protein
MKHDAPSVIGIDTIYQSKGKIPKAVAGCRGDGLHGSSGRSSKFTGLERRSEQRKLEAWQNETFGS